ncbi:FAD binding domain-containing protein [Clostridium sp. DJ247]|uniref:FAD binding domain-containing protein n=1 Tax=Clostridium sp. DJ247 TaxID=2726188 RepID=UPI001625EAC9|nr:FAD binding domain-containing protein [Clostridium sp. DJ247]MBC2581631.1 xanthine dehydrogenase [Clostridium sp. DJ247]
MISFNFSYYKSDSIQEAVNLHYQLSKENKNPLYYSGGTEIITMARRNNIHTEAVIDIKGIPECNVLSSKADEFVVGAAITLTQIAESKSIPLLSKVSTFPADHTARDKITFCGNICGNIIYREAVLGLLITDSTAIIVGKKNKKSFNINDIFKEKILLEKDEFLLQTRTNNDYNNVPYIAIRKNQKGKTGYPLVSMAALKKDNKIRVALSGVCAFPFRWIKGEEYINNKAISLKARVKEAMNNLPAPILDNVQGSADYRKFILENTLYDALVFLEGKKR